MDDKHPSVKLEFTIHKCSSYSCRYVPENIFQDDPTNQMSRWYTDKHTPNQYITLKLLSPAIVEQIIFGKYMKAHVTDLKKFQILGGTNENNLSELLMGGLKNDNTVETFWLRHRTNEGLYLPILYIKIVPLQSWGPAYNYSIWHLQLRGKNDTDFIMSAMETINLRREEEVVRIMLKHLRRRRYKETFEALSRESGVQLEGNTQAKLWNVLVENGDYELSEKIFEDAVSDGELDWYLSWQPYSPRWQQLSACTAHEEERACECACACGGDESPSPPSELACVDPDWIVPIERYMVPGYQGYMPILEDPCTCKPGPRGGHQLVLDTTSSTLYLFGGWNGSEDLDDLWAYDVAGARWALVCASSAQAGGPSPRSCHKMVFDPEHRKLYTLGRYLDNVHRQPWNMNSDLYEFDVASGEWRLLCRDTAQAGGPRLVFDHQMCIDPQTQTIYVFGGRVLPTNNDETLTPLYSGLYAYYIATRTWALLMPDQHDNDAPQPRVGHSMLFHPVRRRLYIFAGQRNKELLLDLWWWDVGTGACGSLAAAATRPPPAAGFTQRATLDPDTDEMFVLSGMSKEKERRVFNMLWVFSFERLTWSCVYRNERVTAANPRPRFAHQLVYDHVNKVHYLFGGNPGNQKSPRQRLADLWELRLARPAAAAVGARARAALREARYRELAARPPRAAAALHYLRHELHDALDHSDPEQVEHFLKLPTLLFERAEPRPEAPRALCPRLLRALERRRARARARGGAELSRTLAAVLGAEDSFPDNPKPFEEASESAPDTWDVEDAGETRAPDAGGWDARAERVALYDSLCQYFRPTTTPPAQDISDLLTF